MQKHVTIDRFIFVPADVTPVTALVCRRYFEVIADNPANGRDPNNNPAATIPLFRIVTMEARSNGIKCARQVGTKRHLFFHLFLLVDLLSLFQSFIKSMIARNEQR